jgi:hypothetical protein
VSGNPPSHRALPVPPRTGPPAQPERGHPQAHLCGRSVGFEGVSSRRGPPQLVVFLTMKKKAHLFSGGLYVHRHTVGSQCCHTPVGLHSRCTAIHRPAWAAGVWASKVSPRGTIQASRPPLLHLAEILREAELASNESHHHRSTIQSFLTCKECFSTQESVGWRSWGAIGCQMVVSHSISLYLSLSLSL